MTTGCSELTLAADFKKPSSSLGRDATRIAATEKPYSDVYVTAFKTSAGKLVVVAINNGTSQRQLQLQAGSAATSFTKYRTTSADNDGYAGQYTVTGGVATAYIDPGSVNTFVGQ